MSDDRQTEAAEAHTRTLLGLIGDAKQRRLTETARRLGFRDDDADRDAYEFLGVRENPDDPQPDHAQQRDVLAGLGLQPAPKEEDG